MSYRRNDSESESVSFDPGEYSTNRRHRKHRRRGSAKVKGACRGGDGKFMSCDERGARPNAGARANTREDDIADRRRGRKSKSTKKSSKRSSWGGSKGGYSKSYSTKGGRKRYGKKSRRAEATARAIYKKRSGWSRDPLPKTDWNRAESEIKKAATILRGVKARVHREVPKSAIDEILQLLKSVLDT